MSPTDGKFIKISQIKRSISVLTLGNFNQADVIEGANRCLVSVGRKHFETVVQLQVFVCCSRVPVDNQIARTQVDIIAINKQTVEKVSNV